MQNLEYIDRYFKGECPPDEISQFEQKILGDPAFAEEVAFYISAMNAAQQEKEKKKAAFRELYHQGNFNSSRSTGIVKKLWPYMAVAAVLTGIVICWFLFFTPSSPQQLADKFIDKHFRILETNMAGYSDTLQTALQFYNDAKELQALQLIEKYIQSDTSRYNAKKYAGIVSLRLKDYDKALSWFNQLGTYRLEVNPAIFYQALTLLKRNLPGDAQQAKLLLQRVVREKLDNKATAAEWLDKL